MSEQKHTPGEWVAECVGVSSAGPDGVDVYEVNNGHTRIAENLTEADARLIAAAPKMLAALEDIGALDEVVATTMSDPAIRGWAYAAAQCARDAITKAQAVKE